MGAAKVDRRIVYDHAEQDATVAKAKNFWFWMRTRGDCLDFFGIVDDWERYVALCDWCISMQVMFIKPNSTFKLRLPYQVPR